jgi:porphobilinogen deaminase
VRVLRAERRVTALLDGGCRTPVAAHASALARGSVRLRAWVASLDGARSIAADEVGDDLDELAERVAAAVLAQGGRELVAGARA